MVQTSLLTALCCSLALAASAAKPRPKPCPTAEIDGDFIECLEDTAVETCKQDLLQEMNASCGLEMDDMKMVMKVRQAAHKILASCRMEEDAAICAEKFANITANLTGGGRPADPDMAELLDKFEASKGIPSALAERLEECQESVEVCMEDAKRAMKNLTGMAMNDMEFEHELRKAGARKASAFIKGCVHNATTEEDKKACFSSIEAKMEAAKASGSNFSDITDMDLRKFARKNAMSDVAEVMKACMETAADEAARKACFERPDLKDIIADGMGEQVTEVTDCTVRSFLKERVQDDVLTMLQSCNESAREKCALQAKKLRAMAFGKQVADITDDMLEMDAKEAMLRQLGDKMTACMDVAEDNATKLAICRTALVKENLKMSKLGKRNWEPSQVDIDMALMEAAQAMADEIAADCEGSRDECMDPLKERAAMAMGKMKEDLTDMDVERLNKKGAMKAAKKAAKARFEAKQENAAVTCEDPFEKYMDGRKEATPGNERQLAVMKKKIKKELAKEMQKDVMEICFEKETKALADACLADFTSKLSGMTDELFNDTDQSKMNAKLKRAKEDASREVVVELFHVCMKAATSQADKDTCKDDMKQTSEVAGLEEGPEDLKVRYQASSLSSAVIACNSSMREMCEGQIKEELKQGGMKARAFGMVKRLAAMNAAAEMWANCKDAATNTDEDCTALASQALGELRGATDAWSNETAARVQSLGEAILNGVSTVLRKLEQVDVEAGTSDSACADAELAALKSELEAGAASFDMANLSDSAVTLGDCSLVYMKARYTASVAAEALNETGMGMLADDLAALLDGAVLAARRLGRRLATVTEAYADQAVEECAETDSSCGSTETTTSTTTSAEAGAVLSFASMRSPSQVTLIGLAVLGLWA